MLRPRMLFGAIIGGALVYFLDPQHGPERRERLRAWWDQNREPVMRSAQDAASLAQNRASEASARVGEKVSEKVTELQERVRREAHTPV